jgi:hypothetical protein
MVDGAETIGSHGGVNGVNNRFTFTIAENSHLTGYNFGELGREARFVSIKDFFTSTPVYATMANVNSNGVSTWVTLASGFVGTTQASVTLNAAKTQLTMLITENGQQQTTTIPVTDPRVTVMGASGGATLFRIAGQRSDFTFTPVSSGGGEGEPESATFAPTGTAATPAAAEYSGELPGPEGEPSEESIAAPMSSSASQIDATAVGASLALTSNGTLPLTTSTMVGPELIAGFNSLPTATPTTTVSTTSTSVGSTDYNATGSSNGLLDSSSAEDDLESEDDNSEEDQAPEQSSDETDAAQHTALQSWNEEEWAWLSGQDDEDEDGEGEAVDEVMASESWEF